MTVTDNSSYDYSTELRTNDTIGADCWTGPTERRKIGKGFSPPGTDSTRETAKPTDGHRRK
jgi:hypothetical protein